MTIPINDAIRATTRRFGRSASRSGTTEGHGRNGRMTETEIDEKAAVESKSYDKWGNRRGFDEAEAVQWAEIVIASVQGREAPLSPMLREQVNAARAALRWREERDTLLAMLKWEPADDRNLSLLAENAHLRAERDAAIKRADEPCKWRFCDDVASYDTGCGTCRGRLDSFCGACGRKVEIAK